MITDILFYTLFFLPLAGFIAVILIPKEKEFRIARVVKNTTGITFVLTLVVSLLLLLKGSYHLFANRLELIHSGNYEFAVKLFVDPLAMCFEFFGTLLIFLIAIFSKHYLHREEGYKRFFMVFLFFAFGYHVILFAANFETLFIGWEILGITSFLLIAFYRQRYLPVKNALKIFSIYRVGDIGLILTMWLIHSIFGKSFDFSEENMFMLSHVVQAHATELAVVASLILFTALIKSALFPFSSWLPRAMEGPTPSSAIFYGAISVHAGAFLLLRTFSLWEGNTTLRIMIGVLGAVTLLLANFTSRVQSTIKSQIGYASITQLGFIFIEIALGWKTIAILHSMSNAFIRAYQLLISPSVVTYKIRQQLFQSAREVRSLEDRFPLRIRTTVYFLSLKEWYLDDLMYRFLWNPLKRFGNSLHFLSVRYLVFFIVPYVTVGIVLLSQRMYLPAWVHYWIPMITGLLGLVFVIKAFTERKSPLTSWFLILSNQVFIGLAVAFNSRLPLAELLYFSSGIVCSGILGFWVLLRLIKTEKEVGLGRFYGHAYEHPRLSLLFFLSCLGLAAFPITPSFIGIDLLLAHVGQKQYVLAACIAISFIVEGIALIRLYGRIFLGPHNKMYHESARRSS